jgi:hypothetical protein
MREHDQSEKLPAITLVIMLVAAGVLWVLIWVL